MLPALVKVTVKFKQKLFLYFLDELPAFLQQQNLFVWEQHYVCQILFFKKYVAEEGVDFEEPKATDNFWQNK